MKQAQRFAVLFALLPLSALAFDSGSTGADGPFNPAASIELQLPESGIFNYTSVNIPAGVTVSFAKNSNNTPVTLLASGDVLIDGTISVNGSAGGAANNGAPGAGGPGGFDGGYGALPDVSNVNNAGGDGLGPGRGKGGSAAGSAGGGSYGSRGNNGSGASNSGPTYGNSRLLPLIGGSGGGGAGVSSNSTNIGPGGGGGAGAILIAASGTLTVNGTITARGGSAGAQGGGTALGGSGSGGGIRLVATTLQGEGVITASRNTSSIDGGHGRIRLEAEIMLRTSATSPLHSFDLPGPLFVNNLPAIRISSIGGVTAPTVPTGYRDIVLTGITTNPVTVGLETINVPLGTLISVTATPERGAQNAVSANSSAVAGTLNAGTASADINIPNGNSIITAQASFTVTSSTNTAALPGQDFSRYANGETVELIKVAVDAKGQPLTTFVTTTGREYTWPTAAVAANN